MDVAAHDAGSADRRTGRNVTTANATVARHLGCSPRTVQQARQVIERLGFSTTVQRGRYLTTAEREAAAVTHGHIQRRMASERDLITPHDEPNLESNVHLPRRGQLSKKPSVSLYSPKRAHKRARSANKPESASLATQRLAAELVQICPSLRMNHIGHLCRALDSLQLDATGWTANDVLDEITRLNQRRNLIEPIAVRNPVALFTAQMRLVLADIDEPPRQRRQRLQRLAAQERRERLRRHADDEARWKQAQADPECQARIRSMLADARAKMRVARSSFPTG